MAPRLRTYIDKGPESAQPIVCELRDRRIAAAIEWLRVGEQ
jgi:hypothetical protein